MSESHRGKVKTEEHRDKLREAMRNYPQEAKRQISLANKGRRHSQATKRRLSQIQKQRFSSPDELNWLRELGRSVTSNPSFRKQASERMLEKWKDPGYKAYHSARLQKLWADENYRRKQIASRKATWQRKEYRKKQLEAIARGLGQQPNSAERRLQATLDCHFPGSWKYTGDGSFIIEGYRPDFTNINGKKEIIELFGDYWHSAKKIKKWSESELGKIMAYNSFGYRCLVIWEYELKNPDTLKGKLLEFEVSK